MCVCACVHMCACMSICVCVFVCKWHALWFQKKTMESWSKSYRKFWATWLGSWAPYSGSCHRLRCAVNHWTISPGPIILNMSFMCNVLLVELYKAEIVVLVKYAMTMWPLVHLGRRGNGPPGNTLEILCRYDWLIILSMFIACGISKVSLRITLKNYERQLHCFCWNSWERLCFLGATNKWKPVTS